MSKRACFPRAKGFTVIEIVMIIVIVGILAVLAIPRFDSYYALKLNGAAKKIAADIRYTQVLASSTHVTHGIIFLIGTDRYGMYHDIPSYANLVEDPLTHNDFLVDFNAPGELNGVDIISVDFGGANRVEFDAFGEPTNGGTVRIRYKGAINRIRVTENTGRVQVL